MIPRPQRAIVGAAHGRKRTDLEDSLRAVCVRSESVIDKGGAIQPSAEGKPLLPTPTQGALRLQTLDCDGVRDTRSGFGDRPEAMI